MNPDGRRRSCFGCSGSGAGSGGGGRGGAGAEAATKGKLVLAVVAPDVSRHSLDKVCRCSTAKRVTLVEGPSAAELGAAVGRETTAVVGVMDWNSHGVFATARGGVVSLPRAAADAGSEREPDRRTV